jgi:hypothetical protein
MCNKVLVEKIIYVIGDGHMNKKRNSNAIPAFCFSAEVDNHILQLWNSSAHVRYLLWPQVPFKALPFLWYSDIHPVLSRCCFSKYQRECQRWRNIHADSRFVRWFISEHSKFTGYEMNGYVLIPHRGVRSILFSGASRKPLGPLY